jgi:hypothetical protein
VALPHSPRLPPWPWRSARAGGDGGIEEIVGRRREGMCRDARLQSRANSIVLGLAGRFDHRFYIERNQHI